MARTATTADVFNAVAERRRRDILDALNAGESAVGDLVRQLDLTQPQVSKHLKVLKDVGVVGCRTDGRRRLYCLNRAALSPLQDWLATFERAANERLDRLDDYLVELQQEESD